MPKLYFFYSSMNAGKTTALLQSSHNYSERGMKSMLFKPSVDVRTEKGVIESRIGLQKPAIMFQSDFSFFDYFLNIKSDDLPHCMMIDEAQFLTKDQVAQLCHIVDLFHFPILTYGLRTDFRGEPFEGSRYLMALADELVELKGVCWCGKKATMNLRVNDEGKPVTDGDVVEIGGNERYKALCRKHFFEALFPHLKEYQKKGKLHMMNRQNNHTDGEDDEMPGLYVWQAS